MAETAERKSVAKRYYWLKLQDDFFSSKRIKKLRKLAGGDTYTIIYLKMQLLAMKQGGYLEYTGLESSFAEELALDLDEEPDNVSVTVHYLLSCGLLETSNDRDFFLPYAVINTGSESASAKRVREHRERKALQSNAPVTPMKQIGNGEIEIEKEIEKEIEIEIEEKEEKEPDDKRPETTPPTSSHIPYEAVRELYNIHCPSLSRCTVLSDARKKAIKARFSSGYTAMDFKTLFIKAEASSFLKGGNNQNWRANFDWLIKDSNMAKVLDGNYDDRGNHANRNEPQQSSNIFMDMLNERRGDA